MSTPTEAHVARWRFFSSPELGNIIYTPFHHELTKFLHFPSIEALIVARPSPESVVFQAGIEDMIVNTLHRAFQDRVCADCISGRPCGAFIRLGPAVHIRITPIVSTSMVDALTKAFPDLDRRSRREQPSRSQASTVQEALRDYGVTIIPPRPAPTPAPAPAPTPSVQPQQAQSDDALYDACNHQFNDEKICKLCGLRMRGRFAYLEVD